jgi:phosphoribosyl 1,2-cyclic phosphodiesterase
MPSLSVTFWGVRGSIACPGPDTMRYGGNTPCLEVRVGGRLLIFDAGTGLRRLGAKLDRLGPIDADLVFSHTHFDHICGLPFFSSIYNPANNFRLWAGHLLPDHTLREIVSQLMRDPFFPVPMANLVAARELNDFEGGGELDLGRGLVLRTAHLNHPNGATGYRVEHMGKSICYVTDTEHVPGRRDQAVLDLVRNADLLVYDCTYGDAQFGARIGWGHSTWEEGIRICEEANVHRLAIFHHDPTNDDARMDEIAAAAEEMRPGTVVAMEGMTLVP